MKKRMIVRADDFGMTHSCNLAVEKSFTEGILTCSGIMAPTPWAEEAAGMARANPQWCIGVHLATIGEWRGYRWRPVLPYDKVSTLVDETGFLYQKPDDLLANPIDYDQLEREFMAQTDLVANVWGVNIGYIDYHYMKDTPEYKEVMLRVAKAFGVPFSGACGETRFCNIFQRGMGTKAASFVSALDTLEPGLWISIHHLLMDDPEARALKYNSPEDEVTEGSARHRSEELAVLTDPAVKERISANGIELIDYRDI